MRVARNFLRASLWIAVLCSSLVPLLLMGCGVKAGSDTGGGGTSQAPTVSVAATPAAVNAGGASTLTVTAANATQVVLKGSDGTSYTLAASGGTQSVTPSATTTYTATASGAGGNATATATVTVGQTVTPAPTVSITANPATLVAGSPSTLTVTATNATQVVITGTDKSSYTLAATGGTQSVTPAATTTYTVTASGAGGTATATATVTVGQTVAPAPTVTMTANPTSILVGTTSTLTVAATNATQIVIAGSDGSSYTLPATGGTQPVSPTATTTYTVTATGAGGTATATASVTVSTSVAPAPTVTITASPTTLRAGSASVLTVTAANATSVAVTGSDGSSYTLPASGGTQSVTPSVTTTYTATATGPGGRTSATAIVTVTAAAPTVTMTANPASITTGGSSTLTVAATGATTVTIAGSDGTNYTLPAAGGTQTVSPTTNTTYTATATGAGGTATATTTVTVAAAGSLDQIQHVIFMLQENHTFDNYFGMLNPYRTAQGFTTSEDGKVYQVDGIDPATNSVKNINNITNQDDAGDTFYLYKSSNTCVDDQSSDWLASYGDVNRYDFLTSRPMNMDGFVHNAEGYANSCTGTTGVCSGTFTSDTHGQRSMAYYDQGYLNYYYYMASQFALSDRWFSPVSDKSIDNRIATFTGGTTQGLVRDPTNEDHLSQLPIPTIFPELTAANVSWKIYYTVSEGLCTDPDDCSATSDLAKYYPATDFSSLSDSYQYLYVKLAPGDSCSATTVSSYAAVGDPSDSFCIDLNHIAPLSHFNSDLQSGTLAQFVFIEPGYGNSDEHPGSGQSILMGQAQVASILNTFMASTYWSNSVFFLAYDEGGGPYDHVPPVPGHSNDYTDPSLKGLIPDIGGIAVNADTYKPCPLSLDNPYHCDLVPPYDPGLNPGDAPAMLGFAAQLGFRVPNMIISPFARKHYVGHIPMDHTAILKFVENRFISSTAHLTGRDAAQPNLLDFFDFTTPPWTVPPTPPPPVTPATLGYDPCHLTTVGH